MLESVYRGRVIKRLKKEFKDCVVIINDPKLIQGMPDLLILFGNRWAMLEVKISELGPYQPNQVYYVTFFDQMSYSAFIWPEIEDRVFNELQLSFSN